MTEKTPLPVKDAARQLCDELSQIGLSLPYMKALDICARLNGYLDWREYEREFSPVDTRAKTVRVVYMTGFSDKGYWWTKAEKGPWLVGAVNVDYAGPFPTQEIALHQAQIRFPSALVVPHEEALAASPNTSGWQNVSVYVSLRLYCGASPRIQRVMRNPMGDEGREFNDCLEFNPQYAQPDGRIQGVAYRSPLKFLRFDTVRRCAVFEFDARLDVTKPSGTGLPQLVDKFRFRARLSDTYEEPDVEVVSWE